MTLPADLPRRLATGIAAALCLLLSGCLLTSGKFDAALDIRRDGAFTYVYNGEIFMLGLSELAQLAAKSDDSGAKFEPTPCFKEGEESEARDCTADEIAAQKAEWEAQRKATAERKAKEAETMRAMLGGIDPANPKAAEELAERLRRQAGWKSVTYAGNGLFKVDFAIRGRLDHDFAFPTIERFPTANAFLVVNRRADGSLRIDAPGFGPASGTGGMGGFAQLAALHAAEQAKKGNAGGGEDAMPPLPQLEGRLVLTTDAAILANNTDDGPKPVPGGQQLEWTVNARSTNAPMALVRLGI